MNEFWAKGYEDPHMLNVLLHVGFGTLGIFLGSVQLVRRKGDAGHRWIGRAFLMCATVLSITAFVGTLVFNRDPFLMTLSVAATYNWLAGWRALHLRETGPRLVDNLLAFVALSYCFGFALYAQLLAGPQWSGVTIYTTLGFLSAVTLYDLVRNIGGAAWLARTWLGEHIYKIVGALGAMVSAASGNMFMSLGALGQVGPSVLFTLLTVFFLVRYWRAAS